MPGVEAEAGADLSLPPCSAHGRVRSPRLPCAPTRPSPRPGSGSGLNRTKIGVGRVARARRPSVMARSGGAQPAQEQARAPTPTSAALLPTAALYREDWACRCREARALEEGRRPVGAARLLQLFATTDRAAGAGRAPRDGDARRAGPTFRRPLSVMDACPSLGSCVGEPRTGAFRPPPRCGTAERQGLQPSGAGPHLGKPTLAASFAPASPRGTHAPLFLLAPCARPEKQHSLISLSWIAHALTHPAQPTN